ncbi:TM2 domain-containing membrane protein YozV [Pontibacter ummariensis]|uniref:TM2 domain-containing membrane protein YozV n=1 Tax=Pontibacter ummariensis TaxID=1610492 RepID=A0A239IYF6_9BACT|nr:NINE protein [Pontibacter ummariensis]PRY09017.1 TM2 domain-containing membrane protein YozV [Pontibacter ummariensis]SNS98422.1 TM2 domain-containing membrane protein YozV [Pontibacter ummariensis]
MKNKTTAALLAFFLGGFGAQFFYLGKAGRGVLCLLFFWTFIPAIIAIIDFIRFLVMSEDEFNRKYNSHLYPAHSPVVVQVNQTSNVSSVDVLGELEKLHRLKESGVLTEEEFSQRKERMLLSN